MHISRVFDFSRDARKTDPFLARNCEKCEKLHVPLYSPFGAQFDQNLSSFQGRISTLEIKSTILSISHNFSNFQEYLSYHFEKIIIGTLLYGF